MLHYPTSSLRELQWFSEEKTQGKTKKKATKFLVGKRKFKKKGNSNEKVWRFFRTRKNTSKEFCRSILDGTWFFFNPKKTKKTSPKIRAPNLGHFCFSLVEGCFRSFYERNIWGKYSRITPRFFWIAHHSHPEIFRYTSHS